MITRLGLVHGFTQTGASWDAVRTAILERADASSRPRPEILCPDAPGHGSRSQVTTDLAGAARILGDEVGRATYVGYSMGGRIALHLALARPDLVDGLVLIGATPGIEDPAQRAARIDADEALAHRLEAEGVAAFLDHWLSLPLFATLPDGAAARESRLANTAAGLASALRTLGTGRQSPLWDRLGEITAPTLVVAGGQDGKFCEIGRRMAARLPRARFVEVADAGHAVHLERPDAVAALVVDTGLDPADTASVDGPISPRPRDRRPG